MKRRLTLTAFVLLICGGIIEANLAPDPFEHALEIRTPTVAVSAAPSIFGGDARRTGAVTLTSEVSDAAPPYVRGPITLTLLGAGAFARLRRRCEATNL